MSTAQFKLSHHEAKPVCVFDTHGKLTYLNSAFCEFSGYSADELRGKSYDFLKHPDMPQNIMDELWHTVKQGFSWQGVLKFRNQQGQEYWLDAFITPQYRQGEIFGYQCVNNIADASLVSRADKIYQALKAGKHQVTFEFSRVHKFILLVLISLVAQGFIFYYGGLLSSIIGFLSAITPILVFWQDIFPMAVRATRMQNSYDSISRFIYFGKGTASVFDFNFSMLKAKIRAILERTSDATLPLTQIVDQVRNGMVESRNNIERQKQEMLQVSTAINEMSTASAEIGQNSVATAEDVKATQAQCQQARSDITQTAQSIRELANEVDRVVATSEQLTSEGKTIGGLMGDIHSIADQTNLLALNAAIEAARAGESGRGFAVVADEVRNLSSRTQQSSSQIQTSLTNMLNIINHWIESMQQNKERVHACVGAAEKTDRTIKDVYQNIDHIANLTSQIATAAEEQGRVTQDINENMRTVSQAFELNWEQTEVVFEQMEMLRRNVDEIANLSATFMPQKKS